MFLPIEKALKHYFRNQKYCILTYLHVIFYTNLFLKFGFASFKVKNLNDVMLALNLKSTVRQLH